MPNAVSPIRLIPLGGLLLGIASVQAAQETLLEDQRQTQGEIIESQKRPAQVVPETSVQRTTSSPQLIDAPEPSDSDSPPIVWPAAERLPQERFYSAGRRAEPYLWALLNEARYAELNREIERLRREDPVWEPPTDLLHWLRHHLQLAARPQPSQRTAAPVSKPALTPRQRRTLAYERDVAAAARLQRQGRSESALERLAPWEARIQKTRDVDRLMLLAWIRLGAGQVEQALADFRRSSTWRPNAEAARGELLALGQLGRDDELIAIAAPLVARWPSLRQTAMDVLRATAADRHEQGDYETTGRLLDVALALDATDRATQQLMAWNDFKREHWREAASRFQSLYREQRDENNARGLTLSLGRLGAQSELADLAKQDDGPLNRLWRQGRAREDYDTKRFVNAWHQAPESFTDLTGIDSHSLLTGMSLSWRSGESGMARLRDWRLPILIQEYRHGAVSVQARIERVNLDAGTLAPGRLVGSPTADLAAPYPFAPTTTLDNGLRPEIQIGREDRLSWTAVLGLTPTQGELPPSPNGSLTLSQAGRGGSWSAKLEQSPVRESLLSYTGLRDPYTGDTWGQVHRRGVSLQGWRILTPTWVIAGSLQAHAYTGHEVANNHGFASRVSLGYDLAQPGFDYINLGPFIDYRHFDRNLSHFTYGHGGYYSPQRDIGVGLSLNFQTEEARPWLLRGTLHTGWRRQEQDSSPWFPLSPDGRYYPSQDNSGLAAGFVLEGAWRLSPHWQLSGSAFIDHSPDFEQGGIMLLLRYQFEPRRALFSDDLRASVSFD
ncbi:cellulose synthase subunit BcsC-related outer membrane protein [Allochromatium palmeri]|uniref:Cellulose synthase operon C C-terminal domain-containing protein n=1 Tax=Allochromatium palmeri TaxID=231048 RepID=A0A6N8E7P8_9GAMM|nr:cellulose synthase subunit BcsC-related outer membrane protein [Allochromatium palmeri]MTW20283.1 hypothetical protein [Allochromatium palmeri]